MRIAAAATSGFTSHAVQLLWLGCLLSSVIACASLTGERLVYDHDGATIVIEADPSVARSKQPVSNAHPARLTTEDVTALLGVVQVSGWSGTIAGIFLSPQPVPLLTDDQLTQFAAPLSAALGEARPWERVHFSFPKPGVKYSEDRTSGALFLRGRYLHVVVTDHSSVLQADTGGDNLKDIRDTKGLRLWIAKPAVEAMVLDVELPRWAPFETAHISLNVKEVLAQDATRPRVQTRESSNSPILRQTNPH